MDDLKKQGIVAFIWDFFGKITTHGMSFIVTIFLARLLEPSDFGLIAIIMVIVGIASIFTDVGLSGALIQRQNTRDIHFSSVFYFNITVGVILTILTYFSAQYISAFYNNKQLSSLIEVLSIIFVINSLSTVQTTKLRKKLNYALLTKVNLVSSLISGITGITLAYFGAGVWSLVAQIIMNSLIYNILIWIYGKWVPSSKFSFRALKQLWGYGFRMFLVVLLDSIYTRLDFLIIGKLFTFSTLGFYQRAKSLNMMAVQYSAGSLKSVLFPILSRVQHDTVRFQNILFKSLGIVSFIVFPLFISLYILAEELIIMLFTDKWLQSVGYFKILLLSGFAYPINAILITVLSSRGNSKAFLRMAMYKKSVAFLNLGMAFIFGIEGFLYGLIIVAFINTSITIFMVAKELAISIFKFYRLIMTQMIIAGIAYFTVTYLVNLDIIPLMRVILFFMTYLLISYVFDVLSFRYFLEQFIQMFTKIIEHVKGR